ncbi:hypothetical protein R5S25_002286 [Acinetobacter baumannii]|nr:hypothetical protein [Acinetobacter baumannii]
MIDFNSIIEIHNELSDFHLDEDLTLKDIYKRIEGLILGEISTFDFLYELKDAFLLEYLVKKNETYKSIFNNLSFITENLRSTDLFNGDINCLKEAYKYCIYSRKKNLQTNGYESSKIKCLASSIIFFESKGLKKLLINGKIDFTLAKKIENIIHEKFKYIGIDAIPNIINTIPKLFDTKFYSFIEESDTQIIPWGYILNKAIKHTYPIKLSDEILLSRLNSAIEYSTHYIALYQFQNYDYSFTQYTHGNHQSILKLIDKHVIGDQLFKIEQYDPKSILEYLNFINTQHQTYELDLILEVATYIFSLEHNTFNDVTKKINQIFQKYPKKISTLVSSLLIHKKVNNKFETIYDLDKIDFNKKPFIKVNSKVYFFNHSFFYIGFYYAFLEILYQIGVDSKKQGLLLEAFAEYSLSSSKQHFISNKNYKVYKPQKAELGIKSDSLEVDLVIHNDESIAFFEIKNRVLINSSKGGNSYYILNDLAESLIKSQTQLNKHKRYISKFKEITFIDKQKLNLDDRKIFKISVSSLDYQSLHAPLVSRNFLSFIPDLTLKNTNKPELDSLVKNINEKFTEFKEEISKPETLHEISNFNGMQNTYFINIFHFLFLIEKSREKNTDFIDELTLYSRTLLNQLDFYYCYYCKDHLFKS